MRRFVDIALLVAACWFAAYAARTAEIKAPESVVAGTAVAIETSGSGDATFYLIGPSHAEKQTIKLGQTVNIGGESVRAAGRYLAVVRARDNSSSAWFSVKPAKPANVNFLARPSRVPVARPEVISGVAFVFDEYRNLVLEPAEVKFTVAVGNAPPATRTETAKLGVAWTRMDSSRKEGAAQFVVGLDGISERRVVQLVASDPCNLRMRAQRTEKAILVETDPIRDCSGNPVPDGTIVTFTAVDQRGRSTVDARIKRGTARAELPLSDGALISVASGVVMGNEIRIGGGR